MSANREEELRAYGCVEPQWFLRDHIPRYAEYYGVNISEAYQAILGELVALDEVRNTNFRQMLDSGVASRMLSIFAKREKNVPIGERPLIVLDNFIYMMRRDPDVVRYDPLNPLAITNFNTMEDPIPVQCVDPIVIGRPNADGELWLDEGITVADYDVAADCFKRLLALRDRGTTPHISNHLDNIYVPHTLGNPDSPFVSANHRHARVDYNGFASGLKVAA